MVLLHGIKKINIMDVNETLNYKALVTFSILFIMGILFALADIFWFNTTNKIFMSIGCSLIASAIVGYITVSFLDKRENDMLKQSGIVKVYKSRSEMNNDSEISTNKAEYKIDVIAFGLQSFREQQQNITRELLARGVNFRIITMDPESDYVDQREKEEKQSKGQIKNTINQLIEWANDLNCNDLRGSVIVKGYSCMTLDFYWRADDDLYIGPYWYGRGSQRTISYKYGKGPVFNEYSEYFDKLWGDSQLMRELTK